MKKAALFALMLLLPVMAHAQTVPTLGEKSIGAACNNGEAAADFDTLAQCTATSGAGTMKKSPIILGTVTAPPYAATTCDTSKAGMLQWTGSAFQGCNGTSWSALGSGSGGGGWVNVGSTIATNLALSTTWTTLDLSSVVGTNQTMVMLEVKSLSSNQNLMIRPQGYTNTIGYSISQSSFGAGTSACTVTAPTSSCFLMLQTSVTGKVEVSVVSGTATATVNLIGYIPPSSAFIPNLWSLNGSNVYYNSGYVGIGTSTPSATLHIASSLEYTGLRLESKLANTGKPYIHLANSGDDKDFAIFYSSNGGTPRLNFNYESPIGSNSASRMVITSAGNVGIGTTTPQMALDVSGAIHATGNVGANASLYSSTFGGNAYLSLNRANGTVAAPTSVASGDLLGAIGFVGHDGAAYQYGATILGTTNGAVAAGKVPVDLLFATGTNSGGIERMRVTSAGLVGIGTASPAALLDVSGPVKIGSGTCASTTAGALQYSGSAMQWCNGTAWSTLASSTSQWTNNASDLYFNTGKVGIGTTTPLQPLQVTSTGSGIRTNYSGFTGIDLFQDSNGTGWLTVRDNKYLNLATNGTLAMTLTNGGNVGIGTASPAAKLDVGGPVKIGSGTCSSTTAGAIQYSGSAMQWCNGTAWSTLASSTSQWTNSGSDIYFNSGNVGIGTTTPTSPLHIYGANAGILLQRTDATCGTGLTLSNVGTSTDGWQIKNSKIACGGLGDLYFIEKGTSERVTFQAGGKVGIGTTTPSYTLHVNGSVAGTSAYNNLSDARMKKDVMPIGYGLDSVMRLRPVGFNWIKQDQDWKKAHQIGLIAQEVEKIVPEVVTTAEDKDQTKSIAYGSLVPVLIKAVQELKSENDALREKLTVQEKKQETMDEALKELQSRIQLLEARK